MEITGKLTEILPEQSGQGKNGTWVKGAFVIETQDQYPKKVCIDVWGDKVDVVKTLNINDVVKVDFDVESREFNGKWYTNVKAWRIEKQNAGGTNTPENNPPLPTFGESDGPADSFEPTDDLPF